MATNDAHAYGSVGDRPVVLSGKQLLAQSVPSLEVVAEDVLTGPSWDMPPAAMVAIAYRVRDAILDERYDGVVVAHGLDTIIETAYLTDLVAGDAAARVTIVYTDAAPSASAAERSIARQLARCRWITDQAASRARS